MTSISSKNIIHGAWLLACSNSSAIAPILDASAEQSALIIGIEISFARHLANNVLPTPGPPANNIPLGILPPIF